MKMVRSFFPSVTTLLLLTGCASMVCGPKQTIAIDSRPRGAQVVVYSPECQIVFSNTTPCTASLQRLQGDSKTGCYMVRIKKAGYAPEQIPLAGSINSAYYLNVLTLGIGFIVDSSNGSMWTLSPEKVQPGHVSDKAGFFYDDGLFVTMKDQAAQPIQAARPTGAFTELTQTSLRK
jgi:hypothetical protein